MPFLFLSAVTLYGKVICNSQDVIINKIEDALFHTSL